MKFSVEMDVEVADHDADRFWEAISKFDKLVKFMEK